MPDYKLTEAAKKNLTYLTLTVLKYNTVALSMYRSFGFKVVSDHTFREKDDRDEKMDRRNKRSGKRSHRPKTHKDDFWPDEDD